MTPYKHVVGIDLGTTNTLACRMKGGKPDFIRFPGGRMLPSVIYVAEDGRILVGNKAKKYGTLDSANLIRSSKTFIGDFEKNRTWNCRGQVFTPTDAATEILKEVRAAYCKHARCDESEEIGAVITVPAYFNSNQTDETRKAGEAAGFKVMQIITEPMAAALAAANYLELSDKKVFVLDLGGGTFDLSVLQADAANHSFTAIDIDGDPRLGGDDFDDLLTRYLVGKIEEDTGCDLSSHITAEMDEGSYNKLMHDVREEAEKCKRELSEPDSGEVNIDMDGILDDYSLSLSVSRDQFDKLCAPLYARIFDRTRRFLENNPHFRKADLGEMILAGGSCYIPYISREAQKIFGRPAQLDCDLSTLVAAGACYVAEGNNSGLDANRLRDILSHSLGVAVRGKPGQYVFSPILAKNTIYPCENKRIYTTAEDNQTEVKLRIYEAGQDKEGEDDIAHHKLYGVMTLEGIRPAPKGDAKIEVSFKYDGSRCLTVTAIDTDTGASQTLRLEKGNYQPADEGPGSAPIDFMLLMDVSYSMDGAPLADAKKACLRMVKDFVDFSVHRIGLVSYSSEASLKMPLSTDIPALNRMINGMKARGTTYIGKALAVASNNMPDDGRQRVIIAVTDGHDMAESMTLDLARELKDSGFRIITIGSGPSIDEQFLRDVASPGDYYRIDDMSQLENTFQRVIQDITQA